MPNSAYTCDVLTQGSPFMVKIRLNHLMYGLGVVLLSACGAAPDAPTITPTFILSAPTLAPSPTVEILRSDQLYGDAVDPNTGSFGQNDLTAAALPSGGSLPPIIGATQEATGIQSVEILMADGARLTGDLYERGMNRVPGVLLVARDTTVWDVLPLSLHAAGLTVLVVRMRETPQPEDIQTLLTALSADGTVDRTRLAIISSEAYGAQALDGCAQNPDCQAAVLLSPGDRSALLSALDVMQPRPIFVAVGQDDSIAYPVAVGLASAASGASKLMTYETGRGTALLTLNAGLYDEIVTWLMTQFAAPQ
jgi:hypothetical protein